MDSNTAVVKTRLGRLSTIDVELKHVKNVERSNITLTESHFVYGMNIRQKLKGPTPSILVVPFTS